MKNVKEDWVYDVLTDDWVSTEVLSEEWDKLDRVTKSKYARAPYIKYKFDVDNILTGIFIDLYEEGITHYENYKDVIDRKTIKKIKEAFDEIDITYQSRENLKPIKE